MNGKESPRPQSLSDVGLLGRGRRAIGTLFMWITQHIAARAFVWLAAVTIPLQGLPSVACGCSIGYTSDLQSCCSGVKVCRCGDNNCSCGTSCQCGQDDNTPTEPAAPPIESSSPVRIIADSAATAFSAAIYQLSSTRRNASVGAEADASAALDRCVTLCRFTI